jgi:hypothetical protein
VESVLADVPKADRCRCRETGSAAKTKAPATRGSTTVEASGDSAIGRFKSWLKQ